MKNSDPIIIGRTVANKTSANLLRGSVLSVDREAHMVKVVTFPQDVNHLFSLKYQWWPISNTEYYGETQEEAF